MTMTAVSQENVSKKQVWTGRIFTGFVTMAMLGSGIAKMAGAAVMVDGLTRAGIPSSAILPIAVLELTCLVLYLVPRTKLLGLLLLTGYFGGAVVTHIIGRENFFPPLLIGFVGWVGAYLQTPALWRLFPVAEVEQGFDRRGSAGASTLAKAR